MEDIVTLETVIREMLDELDPKTLEAMALEKLEGLDGGLSTGEAFLESVKEMLFDGD